MQFIDTHIHLQDFKADFAPQVWKNLEAKKFVLVSAAEEDFAKIADLWQKYPDKMIGAFGIHPWYAKDNYNLEVLREYLRLYPKALVGEIGVDALKEPADEVQHEFFSAQLAVAMEFNRPVVVHAAKAFEALKEHEAELKKVKFSHHGFVKNRELIKFINKCGGYFGIGALFLRQENAALMLKEMPKDKILFETDAPYRLGEEDYNRNVQENLLKLAKIAEVMPEVLEEILLKNAEEFLKC